MGRRSWALVLACAFTVLFYLSYWTMGPNSVDANPIEPWYALSYAAAFLLGVVSDRWRYMLVALVVLAVGLGPQMGTPDSDGATLNDWWILIGPLYTVFFAGVIAVGVLIRKLAKWARRRSGGKVAEA